MPIGCRLLRVTKSDFSATYRPLCFRNALHCQHNSIIDIEHSVNDTNVIVVSEDEQFVMPFTTPATYLVTEAVNSSAAKAADAKKAPGPLVIRMRKRFRSR